MEWRAETAVVATEVNPEGHDHEQVGIPTWEGRFLPCHAPVCLHSCSPHPSSVGAWSVAGGLLEARAPCDMSRWNERN